MKFLVLALCVCAASAASFGASSGFGGYKPYKPYSPAAAPVQVASKAFNTVAAPFQVAAKAVAQAAAPVVAPVAYQPVQQAAVAAYQPAQQVVTKSAGYTKDAEAAIIRSDSDVRPDGYNFVYETANGISAEATGVYRAIGDAGSVAVKGSYRYVGDDGVPVLVTYIADENGYQPQSDILPVGPPVPEAIARSLAYIAAQPQPTEYAKKY